MRTHSTRTAAAGVVLVTALFTSRCTSSSTNLAGPTEGKCQLSVANAPSTYAATGGTGTISITTTRECTWSIAAEASWVTLNADASGQGNATVTYSVVANPVPAARTGALVVGDERLPLTQAAAPCRYELNRNSDSIPATGGRLTVDVTTLTGCGWTAASTVGWISLNGGSSSSTSGTVDLSVSQNTGAVRVGQVNVAGQTYTVTQAAAAPAPPVPNPPAPTPAPPVPAPPPSPAPGPGPAPAPQPTIEFQGKVSRMSGRCPSVSFTVNGNVVAAGATTEFRRGDCGDLSNGDRVKVWGTRRPDGVVVASRVEITEDDDD